MASKTSKFVPLFGSIIGGIILGLDGFEAIDFTIDYTSFWAFMAFTVGGSSAYGIFKNMRKKE